MSKVVELVTQSDGTSLVYLENGDVKKASIARLKKYPLKKGDVYTKVEYDKAVKPRVRNKAKQDLENQEVVFEQVLKEDVVLEKQDIEAKAPVVKKPRAPRKKK